MMLELKCKKPFSIFVPGWGNRLRPRLTATARRWTREQPRLTAAKDAPQRMFRTLVGPAEAQELALITLLGVVHLLHG